MELKCGAVKFKYIVIYLHLYVCVCVTECDKWTGGEEGVTTISCASLPTTYVTLPRTRHLYTQSNTQVSQLVATL